MIQSRADGVDYYVDGVRFASHSGSYAPDTDMRIAFQMWFYSLGTVGSSRQTDMDIDWVYHGKNTVLSTADVQYLVSRFRSDGVARRDTAGVTSDTTPDGFTFTDVTGADLNTTYTSKQITVGGINAAAAISITGGSYSVNGSAFTTAAGTVNNGNTVTVRQTSSANYSTKTSAMLTIGGVSDSYDVTTKTAPQGPSSGPFYLTDFPVSGKGLSDPIINSVFDHKTTMQQTVPDGQIYVFSGEHAEGLPEVRGNYASASPLTFKGRNPNFPGGKLVAYDNHDGIDYHGGVGDRVVAAAGGIVTAFYDHQRASSDRGKFKSDCGNYVEVTHPGGFKTWYLHLSTVDSKITNKFQMAGGADVGKIGGSGGATEAEFNSSAFGPHLHFGLFKDTTSSASSIVWQKIDPYGWSGNQKDDPYAFRSYHPRAGYWALANQHSVVGHVFDASGRPVAGVEVTLETTAALAQGQALAGAANSELHAVTSKTGENRFTKASLAQGQALAAAANLVQHTVTSETGEYRFGGISTGASYTVSVTAPIGSTGSPPQTFTNASGDSAATFSVSSPVVSPSITQQPQSITVTLGEPVSFFVQAAGSGDFSYQWRKGGVPIPGETNAELSIAAVAAADNGSYFDAVVSNPGGSVTTIPAVLSVTLRVNVLPVFTSTAAATFTAGQAASFTVTAIGVPAPTFSITAGTFPSWASLNATTGVISGTPPNAVGSPFGFTLLANNGVAPNATQNFTVTVQTVPLAPTSAGFALIPAGMFTMGDSLDGNTSEQPTHAVTLSAFFLAKTEVTWAEWREVRDWAVTHGYTDLTAVGAGKADTHPVQMVSWFDVVKWCNAKSEKDGLVPVYYTDDAQTTVYQTGNVNVTIVQVKWTATGYRLPTEAEWEYAARGGVAGKRFPMGDTITHQQANYYSDPSYAYDTSATRSFRPIYRATGGFPYTSPVGSFAMNGYGLHDMAGNVWEWCWDWYGSYGSAAVSAPLGPLSGTDRVRRSGGWADDAFRARSALHSSNDPVNRYNYVGFRPARSSSSESTPTITTPPQTQTAVSGNTISFTVSAIGSGPLTYQWKKNGADLPNETTATLTLINVQLIDAGSYTVVVSNGAGSKTSDAAILTVRANSSPTVSISSPASGATFTAPAAVTISANASDSDGSISKVEFFSNGATLGEDTTSPYSFSWSNVTAGNYSLTAKATDNQGAITTSAQVNITVNPATTGTVEPLISAISNQTTVVGPPPSITAISEQVVQPGGSTGPISFTVDSKMSFAGFLQVTGKSSNQSFLSDANIRLGGNDANRTVTIGPVANASGSATVTLTVMDTQGQSNSVSFRVSAQVNTAPTISAIPNQATLVNQPTSAIPFIVNDAETPAGSLTITAASNNNSLVNPSANIAFGGSGSSRSLTIASAQNQTGAAVITLTVTDAGGMTASTSFTLTVTGKNPPIISSIANQTINKNSSTGPIAFTISDGETPSANLSLSATSSNPTLVPTANIVFGGFGSSRTVAITPTANQIGTSTIVITVTDAGGAAVTSTNFTLTVRQSVSVKGDLNGDGISDILFQDGGGYVALSSMKGKSLDTASYLAPSNVRDTNYRIVGTGDFDADGHEDVLFQHANGTLAVWYMNGTAQRSADLLTPSTTGDANWRIVGTGDLDGDGKVDIIFQHTSGALAVWMMDGVRLKVNGSVPLTPASSGSTWRVVAVTDLNGDGKPDLVFQNSISGDVVAWMMDGTSMIANQNNYLSPQNPGSGWRIVGAGQYSIPFSVALNGGNERPNVVNTVATGTGTVMVQGEQIIVNINFTGLSSVATAAHFHGPANADQAAGVIIPLTVTPAVSGTVTGAITATSVQIDMIFNGQAYINIHTVAYPSGEIRGQVVRDPTLPRKSDLIFQTPDLNLGIWFMDGFNMKTSGALTPSNSGGTWKVVAPK